MAKPRRKLSKKEQRALNKSSETFAVEKKEESKDIVKKKISIPEVLTVQEFANIADLPVTQVITELMNNGVLATINETIDFETAVIIGDNLGLDIEKETGQKTKQVEIQQEEKKDQKNLVQRPAVVTIMGHVDHGKTTLLDNIRKAHVASTESGGITQHISAYQVSIDKISSDKELKNKTITFIDTPGHAAFSALRSHGAAITDIVVLIVAADDGVMPQTKEVIEQAKANNVPIIVAINKIDLPDSDVMKVKQQLSEYDLVPEDWGGKTIMVEISAKSGKGIDELLEMILLQADLMDLKADPNELANGVVIESHMQKGAGAMALVLVENGTLKKSDPISIGKSFGKVRILQDYTGKTIETACPSFPVRVAGLKSLPQFGDRLLAFRSEKEAKENSLKALGAEQKINIATAKKIDSEETTCEKIILSIIIKSDVAGSLEAIKKSIKEIQCIDADIKIISEGVGAVSESDATLAKATDALIYGFRVKVLGAAKRISEKENIKIKTYQVIYELINDIKSELSDALPPEIIKEELAHGEVLAIFRDDKKGFVAGGKIEEGQVCIGDEIMFLQNKNEKYRDKITTLRREKNEVKECATGQEFGFGLNAGANVAVGDKFVVFKTIEKKRKIE